MPDEKENLNLPARGGEFVHSFSKESEWRGPGIVVLPLVIIAFLFFIVLATLMLAAGGVSLLLGKPAKLDFRHSFGKSRDIFGKKHFANSPGRNEDADDAIDVEATEISSKEIDGLWNQNATKISRIKLSQYVHDSNDEDDDKSGDEEPLSV
jgi:hypothetical protein